jgi:hypothetical protein
MTLKLSDPVAVMLAASALLAGEIRDHDIAGRYLKVMA